MLNRNIIIIFLSLINHINLATPNLRNSSEPYISGDSFRSLADHLFDETNSLLDPNRIKHGDIIFIKTDYLKKFFDTKHPYISHPYIIITHNSDYGAPNNFESYLNDTKIIAWFGQNPTISNHKKFIPIPIGLANQCWQHGNVNTFKKAINKLKMESIPTTHLVGINFRPGTNQTARQFIYDYFNKQPFCKNIETDNHLKYLTNMATVKFILSPFGNGLDCHRTWEALLMGAIPIVKTSTLDPLFVDLPILVVNDWNEITPEFLEKEYIKIINKKYSLDKAYFTYWKNLILSYKNKGNKK